MNTALTQPEHTMVTPTCSLNLGGKMTEIDFLSFTFFEVNGTNLIAVNVNESFFR